MIQSKRYDGVTCTLVNVKTGVPIDEGTVVRIRNEDVKISGGRAPHKPGSTGKVWVQDPRTSAEQEFYPGVVDAQWMPSAVTLPDDTQFASL